MSIVSYLKGRCYRLQWCNEGGGWGVSCSGCLSQWGVKWSSRLHITSCFSGGAPKCYRTPDANFGSECHWQINNYRLACFRPYSVTRKSCILTNGLQMSVRKSHLCWVTSMPSSLQLNIIKMKIISFTTEFWFTLQIDSPLLLIWMISKTQYQASNNREYTHKVWWLALLIPARLGPGSELEQDMDVFGPLCCTSSGYWWPS